jgi:hypothetical protein
MKRLLWPALVLLGACGPEPDLVLPLRVTTPLPPERPRRLAMVEAGSGSGGRRSLNEDPPLTPFERKSSLRFERRIGLLKEPELEKLLDLLMDRRRAIYKYWGLPGCGYPDPWMSWMAEGAFLQADHFSDLYPEYAQRRALKILEDRTTFLGELLFALHLIKPKLCPLSEALEGQLVRLAEDDESSLSWRAQALLGFSDRARFHRPLFRTLAAKGSEMAFDLLSLDSDPESIAFLKNLSRMTPGPEDPGWGNPFRAAEALERLAILDAPDWKRQVTELLKREMTVDSDDAWGWWADTVAEKQLPEEGLAYYRRYIESVRKKLSPSFRNLKEADAKLRGRSFLDQCIRGAMVPGTALNYDVALLGYATQGGELTVWEAKRLEYFGYLGDREARLQEILKPGFRW